MTDSYVAWNGENYPWPPPEGWEKKADGRYWPADSAPVHETERPVSPPPSDANAATEPQELEPDTFPPPAAAAPPPAAATQWQPPPAAQQQTYQPPPGVTPMAGVPYVPPEKKKSGASKVLIGILIGLVVLVGGCTATLAIGGLVFGDKIEDAVDDFVESQEEAAKQTTLEQDTCTDRAGRSVVDITVENSSGGTSDYFITVRFLGASGEIATTELTISRVEPGEERTEEAVSDSSLGTETKLCEIVTVFRLGSR